MGSIRRVIELVASADVAWAALRDWQRLHQVLVPGFATAVVVNGRDRVVTFASGNVLRERIIDVLPEETVAPTTSSMEAALAIIRITLSG